MAINNFQKFVVFAHGLRRSVVIYFAHCASVTGILTDVCLGLGMPFNAPRLWCNTLTLTLAITLRTTRLSPILVFLATSLATILGLGMPLNAPRLGHNSLLLEVIWSLWIRRTHLTSLLVLLFLFLYRFSLYRPRPASPTLIPSPPFEVAIGMALFTCFSSMQSTLWLPA